MTNTLAINTLLRVAAMGGKFVFLVAAAASMPADDFGRIGIVMAAAMIVVALVGLEGYQTLLRHILQGEPAAQAEARGFYLRFSLVGALISGVIAALIFAGYGWRQSTVILGALVVMVEHANIEVCRMLIAEGRTTLATLAMSLRSGMWAIALPMAAIGGLLKGQWSEGLVLATWLICSAFGLLCFLPLSVQYSAAPRRARHLLAEVFGASITWVIVNVSWRALENGGRFAVLSVAGEAETGRFTLVSTLASFGLVAIKGIIEPMFFQKIVASQDDQPVKQFGRAIMLALGGGAAGTAASLVAFNHFTRGATLSADETWATGMMVLGFGCMCASQTWHFRLYKLKLDAQIMCCNLIAGLAGTIVACLLVREWHFIGVASGVILGGVMLVSSKMYFVRLNIGSAPL